MEPCFGQPLLQFGRGLFAGECLQPGQLRRGLGEKIPADEQAKKGVFLREQALCGLNFFGGSRIVGRNAGGLRLIQAAVDYFQYEVDPDAAPRG